MNRKRNHETPRRVFVFITLGSNIEPERNLPRALDLLAQRITVHRVAPVYQSSAVNADGLPDPAQEAFLNTAVLAETDLPPARLKFDVLRPIETELGRIRGPDKYAPRPIDLDIALYGDERHEDREHSLVIPDPEIETRAHIALPLADLAPGFVHPLSRRTLGEIAERFAGAPGIRRHPLMLFVPRGSD